MKLFDKIEPHSIEAEMGTLGAMILERKCIDYVLSTLSENDFYLNTHRDIFKTITRLYQNDVVVDIVTLSQNHDTAYIISLIDSVSTVESIKHYVSIVKGKSIRRQYIEAGMKIIDSAYNGEYDNILDFKNDVSQIVDISISSEKKSISDMSLIADVLTDIENKQNGKDVKIKYGIEWLDTFTGGIHPSDLTILAARPSVGKTALALQIAINIAMQKRKVAIFSLEMSNKQLVTRILTNISDVDSRKIRSSNLSDGDWSHIGKVSGRISELPISFQDTAFKVEEIRSFARQIKQSGLDYIIVDYLQLCDTLKKTNSTNERVSHLSRQFKLIAKELNVGILLLSQLSRESERSSRRPQLIDLRDSGSIEQDADNVFFLHDPSYGAYDETKNEIATIELIIAKQRNGTRDVYTEIGFKKSTQRFLNIRR